MEREELLAVIDEAKRSGLTSLYLGEKGLDEIPSEIGQLTNLTCLNLSENNLTSLPESIAHLDQLTELSIRMNRLIPI
jgi:internalin A